MGRWCAIKLTIIDVFKSLIKILIDILSILVIFVLLILFSYLIGFILTKYTSLFIVADMDWKNLVSAGIVFLAIVVVPLSVFYILIVIGVDSYKFIKYTYIKHRIGESFAEEDQFKQIKH